MNRLIIIVEGDTEKEFIDRVLSPYLYSKGLQSISSFKIKHTKGGLVKYQHLKTDLINCVYESDVIISTLIDYYALPEDFPKYDESKRITNKSDRLCYLEKAIIEDVESEQDKRFPNLLPYIQLHEFEALVFSSIDGLKSLFSDEEADFIEIQDIISKYPNPEDINNNILTAPSKRLENIIRGYNKVLDGIMIIEEIGIENILAKCPRFNSWVQSLIEQAKK